MCITWLTLKPAKYSYCMCNNRSKTITHIPNTFN